MSAYDEVLGELKGMRQAFETRFESVEQSHKILMGDMRQLVQIDRDQDIRRMEHDARRDDQLTEIYKTMAETDKILSEKITSLQKWRTGVTYIASFCLLIVFPVVGVMGKAYISELVGSQTTEIKKEVLSRREMNSVFEDYGLKKNGE